MKTDSIRAVHKSSEGREASLHVCRTRKSRDRGRERGGERERMDKK